MVTRKTSTTHTIGDRSKTVEITETVGADGVDVKAIRKGAFKEAADRLRVVAAELLQSRESVQASAPKFIQTSPAFKMETRSIMERVNVLQGLAGVIEAME
jgi:hypothetical protein